MSDFETSSSRFRGNLQRGELLCVQGRHAEAEKYLQQAIGEEPNNAEGYYQLAFCYCNWTNHNLKALATVDRAISFDANRADCFALRSWILSNLRRHEEAIRVAEHALEMNPYEILALNAQTRAHGALSQWKQAEASARRTVAFDARNELATNLLAQALRQQGRLPESNAVTAGLLAHTPDSAMAHCNSGWSALQAGNHLQANRHFLEALRLEPDFDYAREGLLHSFNSRVWIYRIYLQSITWLNRHSQETRFFLIFIVFIIYRVVILKMGKKLGDEGIHWVIASFILYIALFGLGHAFGNLFLLLDPTARHALTRREKESSLAVGALYLAFLGYLIFQQAWLQSALLICVPLFFLWGVLSSRLQNAAVQSPSSDKGL